MLDCLLYIIRFPAIKQDDPLKEQKAFHKIVQIGKVDSMIMRSYVIVRFSMPSLRKKFSLILPSVARFILILSHIEISTTIYSKLTIAITIGIMPHCPYLEKKTLET